MTQTSIAPRTCPDCGVDVSAGALIISTVVGPNVMENVCCVPVGVADTLDGNTCMARFLLRASNLLHAPIEWYGHGYAEVFVDDNHFLKISPSFGPLVGA